MTTFPNDLLLSDAPRIRNRADYVRFLKRMGGDAGYNEAFVVSPEDFQADIDNNGGQRARILAKRRAVMAAIARGEA